MPVTVDYARSRLRYVRDSGELLWVDDPAVHPPHFSRALLGKAAGRTIHDGYRTIKIAGQQIAAHKLAWLIETGEWAAGDIDHKNGVRTDNRWDNLRDCTRSQNSQNSRGRRDGMMKGAYPRKNGRWSSAIRADGKNIPLGSSFASEAEAHAAYCAAAAVYHRDYARTE